MKRNTVMHRRAQNITNSETERRISEEIFDGEPSQAELLELKISEISGTGASAIPRFIILLSLKPPIEVFLNSVYLNSLRMLRMSTCFAPAVKTQDLIERLGVGEMKFLNGGVIKVHLGREGRYGIFSDPIDISEIRPSSSETRLQDQSFMAGNGRMSSSGDVFSLDSVAGSESSHALLLHRNARMSSSGEVLLSDSVADSESSDALLLHRNSRMTRSDSISLDPVERSPIADLEGVRSGLPTVPARRSTSPWIEATDLSMGILAFVLDIVLLWIEDSRPFELVVLVVSWINCLTAWTIFLWGARWRRAKFALPRFVLPNGQPYGHPIDYVEKYTSLALVVFTTLSMVFKFSKRNFSTTALVLSGTILGAKLGIEYQKRDTLIREI